MCRKYRICGGWLAALLVLASLAGCQMLSGDKKECDPAQLGTAKSGQTKLAAETATGNSRPADLATAGQAFRETPLAQPEWSPTAAGTLAAEAPRVAESDEGPFTTMAFPPAPPAVEVTGPLLVPALTATDESAGDAEGESASLPSGQLLGGEVLLTGEAESSAAATTADSVAR